MRSWQKGALIGLLMALFIGAIVALSIVTFGGAAVAGVPVLGGAISGLAGILGVSIAGTGAAAVIAGAVAVGGVIAAICAVVLGLLGVVGGGIIGKIFPASNKIPLSSSNSPTVEAEEVFFKSKQPVSLIIQHLANSQQRSGILPIHIQLKTITAGNQRFREELINKIDEFAKDPTNIAKKLNEQVLLAEGSEKLADTLLECYALSYLTGYCYVEGFSPVWNEEAQNILGRTLNNGHNLLLALNLPPQQKKAAVISPPPNEKTATPGGGDEDANLFDTLLSTTPPPTTTDTQNKPN